MPAIVLMYVILALAISISFVLLSSKVMAEKLVGAGLLPRSFLGFLPAIQTAIRAIAVALVLVGSLGIGIEGGWISRELLEKFGAPGAVLLAGIVLLLVSRKD